MVVGVCIINLMIYDSNSLKEKRQVIRSLIERIKSRFNVSVAEIGLNDIWRSSEIAIACVSNERAHIDKTMNSILNFIDNDTRVEVVSCKLEIY